MASITKSSGTLFPLISQMKDQNQNQTVVEPKLKRTVGQRQDVRTGDGLTTIMSKVWGLLKKQDDFTKAATKEFSNQVKFRKESKDLMKKNNDVVLKALNALNKDSTKILTKILKAEDKSLKEQEKALEQQKVSNELKNDFAKENKKETLNEDNKRHEEIVELLKKMVGQGDDENKKVKKEKKGIFEKIFDQLGKDFKFLIKDVFVGAFGRMMGNFLSGLVLTIPKLLGSGVRLALAHPLGLIATAMVGIDKFFSDWTKDHADEKMKDTQKSQQEAAGSGDLEKLEKLAKSQVTQEMMTGKFDANGKVSDVKKIMESKLIESKNAPALEEFYKQNPNMRPTQNGVTGKVQNIKPGAESAGPAEQGTEALKQNLGSKIGGFNRITAVKDEYHKENAPHSKHNEGLAVDFTVKEKTPEAYAAAATQVREHLRSTGLKDGGTNPDFKVIDEYKSGTAPHIHVQFRDKTAANQYLASNGNTSVDNTQMAAIQAPAGTTTNQTAALAPEEQQKPKFLEDIIKSFATTAQAEFDASKGLFQMEPNKNITPSSKLNSTVMDSSKLRDRLEMAKAQTSNQPVNVTTVTNNAVSNGGGGTSGVPLGPRSNDSALARKQQAIAVVI